MAHRVGVSTREHSVSDTDEEEKRCMPLTPAHDEGCSQDLKLYSQHFILFVTYKLDQ
jgi:hypothetical protein